MTDASGSTLGIRLTRAHDRRLRAMYRSAGWPCLDGIEIELLSYGLMERVTDGRGAEYLRVTDAGITRLAQSLHQNRQAFDAHEALVDRVAREMAGQGRIAWRGLTLLGKPDDVWQHLRPDVFSIRNTTVEDYVEPLVHEIKVQRADLLCDLRKPEKRAGYRALASGCYYVLAEGIGTADDIPPECGVMIATPTQILVIRSAPRSAIRLSFHHWMALTKAHRVYADDAVEPLL
ncbi:hypothetical protein [uncultured Nevskia sp.]|uniref:hypothetical protein n=1 Tax=uncultured Nevskia sp. TaxID=228950 RepID=UPI0025EAE89D|nr:hypothetical protein [uncultured Nevskia sp.]